MELAEDSPIIIQNSSNPSSQKIWMYNHTTIQGATLNMHGQLYCGHTNATALFSSPVVSALGSESDDLGSSPGLGKVLFIRDVRGKKMQAPLLGLAKSIYYKTNSSVIDHRGHQNEVRTSVTPSPAPMCHFFVLTTF